MVKLLSGLTIKEMWVTYILKIIKVYGKGSMVDYYGLTPQEERQDNIRKFQNDSKCRFLGWYTTNRWLWYYTYTGKHRNLLF